MPALQISLFGLVTFSHIPTSVAMVMMLDVSSGTATLLLRLPNQLATDERKLVMEYAEVPKFTG